MADPGRTLAGEQACSRSTESLLAGPGYRRGALLQLAVLQHAPDQAVIQTNTEDKAIWTATVDNGAGWRNKFTLLKIAPALIWTDAAERPSPYSGSLVVEDGTASTEKPETTCEIPNEPAEQQQAPETKMTLHQPEPSVAKPANETRAIAKPSTEDQEETDDLYALLGNINSPPEELDTSHDSPAASPTNTRGEENLQQPLGNKELTDCAPEAVEDVFMPSRSTDLGQGFVGWMKSGIATRRLFINDTKALVHTVDGTAMLVTPGIFKRYVQSIQSSKRWPWPRIRPAGSWCSARSRNRVFTERPVRT